MNRRALPQPWHPNLPFNWATAGRALSPEERVILRRLVKKGRGGARRGVKA